MSHPPDCRILCVSANEGRALAFIQRIKDLTDPASLEPPSASGSSHQIEDIFPWTIVNKYYSADVHFQVQTPERWKAAGIMTMAPAVIFVWALGEPWRQHVQELAKGLERNGCEPEVALAVRMRTTDGAVDESEDEGVDEFLSQLGFEFVDARNERDRKSHNRARDNPDSNDIPDLPRVLDALSTIMWPSMKSTTGKRRTQVDLDAWTHQSIEAETGRDEEQEARLRTALAKLEQWVESDVTSSPPETHSWFADDSDGDDSVEIITSSIQSGHSRGVRIFSFDDDFTAFVSAPVAHPEDGDGTFDVEDLDPMLTGASYTSLGSQSNFEGEGDELGEDDDVLPTREEIQAASEQIFGRAWAFPPTSTFEPWDSEAPAKDDDVGAFDLTSVFSALDGMKAEIAGIEDHDERRKAAARVALGLVHGLDVDGSR